MVYAQMSMRPAAALIAIVAIALLGPGATAGAAPEATVKVGDFFFAPAKKSVTAGTKVSFKWVGSQRHHVVKQSGPGGKFESPATSARGVNLVKRFNKAGVYRIICTIHPEEMRLKLTVR
jgi:plastocyanin